MADKRISQLVERVSIANNDVLPIVASGATTTNKVTISSIQTYMQENLDVGVTSVGITIGTSGTDVNVTGSPVTTSGNITINIPTASATNRGLLSAADWIIFNNKQDAGNFVTLDTAQTITAQKTFTTSGSSDTMIISHGSGSGIALDVIKAGDNEAIRVQKTSGSGNAVTITGGLLSAEASAFSGNIAANGGLTLAASGSADPTILRNTSGVTGSTSNSNTIGFNGVNNIFVSTQNRGGFILGFNNSVSNREYTLPDASGTIALTSNLGAYLPLTGGTLTGALNGTSASFNTTNAITLTASDSRIRGGDTTGRLLLANSGTTTYGIFHGSAHATNPNAIQFYNDNTLSLSLSSTGAATFSNVIQSYSSQPIYLFSTPTDSNYELLAIDKSATDARIRVYKSGTGSYRDLIFETGGSNTLRLASTGAATFSSSVTAASYGIVNESIFRGGLYPYKSITGSGTDFGMTIFAEGGTGNGNIYFCPNGSATKAMTINTSGNVVIGTSIPGANSALTIKSRTTSGQGANIYLNRGADRATHQNYITFESDSYADEIYIGNPVGSSDAFFGTRHGNMIFQTGAYVERMRITSGGNVGIGTTSPKSISNGLSATIGDGATQHQPYLALARNATGGFFAGIRWYDGDTIKSVIQEDADFNLRISTSNTERMRITSEGDVGTFGSSDALFIAHSGSAGTSQNLIIGKHSATAPFTGTTSFVVRTNGNVQNTNNSYGSLSDIKLKENIEDATPKLDDLMKVKVRNYNLIGDDKKQIGVIAQELEEVFPAMVDESEDFEEVEVPQVDEEGNEILNEEGEVVTTKERVSKGTTTKSVKYSVFVPMLIKAMQEQQEQIKSLTEQVEALKSQING